MNSLLLRPVMIGWINGYKKIQMTHCVYDYDVEYLFLCIFDIFTHKLPSKRQFTRTSAVIYTINHITREPLTLNKSQRTRSPHSLAHKILLSHYYYIPPIVTKRSHISFVSYNFRYGIFFFDAIMHFSLHLGVPQTYVFGMKNRDDLRYSY